LGSLELWIKSNEKNIFGAKTAVSFLPTSFHNIAIFSNSYFISKIMNKRDLKTRAMQPSITGNTTARRPEMNANDWETALWRNRINGETVCVCVSVEVVWSLYVFGAKSSDYGGDVF